MATPTKRIPYFTTETTIDVDIDPDDLHDAGWHHKYECPAEAAQHNAAAAPWPPRVSLLEAVDSLHRQAHPSQLPDVAVCLEEPCRSLTLDQIRGGA